ncbi:MAG: bleomycin resistance protein, partial [Acidimicrobiales bacterium]
MISVMADWKRIAPIFPVRDLSVSLAFYRRLGFSTHVYDDGGIYGFATRDGIEIHLGVAPGDGRVSSAYLFVEDSEDVAEKWRAA